MSGLLRRLTRRRPATADETGSPAPESSEPAGATADTPAEPGGGQPVAASSEQATQVLPQTGEQPAVESPTGVQPDEKRHAGADQTVAVVPVRDLPAGVDPSEYSDAPGTGAPRGKQRRRLRYLRRVRDLLLRDLGGFTFEIHRTAGGTPTESHRKLIESKLNRIEALDAEVRALEGHLGEPHEAALLREPGIGGTCPECGELHSSDAHYCARCGAPLDAKARARREAAVAAAVEEKTTAKPTAEAAPAGVLWAAGPRPAGAAPEPEPEEQRSEITNRWLAGPRRADAAAPDTTSKPDEAQPDVAAGASEGDPVAAGDEAASKGVADEPVAGTPDESAADDHAKDERPADEGADEPPDFAPAPNGRRTDDVPAPDPLPSRPERGA